MKKLVLGLLDSLGYELRRKPDRVGLESCLRTLRKAGFVPASVLDVGAAHGRFALGCAEVFPDARYLLVEPLTEYRPDLDETLGRLGDAVAIEAVASARAGEITLNVHEDLVGSSLFAEAEGKTVDGTPRTVPAITLADEVAGRELKAPHLLKIDVQGAELEVLGGAEAILGDVGVVIVEVSFLEFFDGAPLAADVVAWMGERGFVPYDVFGLAHRPLDGALAQADLVFVPADSPLRADKRYATPEQRARLTARLKGA